MRPSEYFDRNCCLGASNTRRRELAQRYEIGVGNIMWGNDFPHPEGTWPHTRVAARGVLGHPRRRDRADARRSTPAEFYGFDVDGLRPLADRIGPTPEDLGQTTPEAAAAREKWDGIADAGRPWVTGIEAVPVPVRSTDAY